MPINWNPYATTTAPPTAGQGAAGDIMSAGINFAQSYAGQPPSSKQQAQQQYQADINRMMATDPDAMLKQLMAGRFRAAQIGGSDNDFSRAAPGLQKLVEALKNPETYHLKEKEGGGYTYTAPKFDSDQFSGLQFGKVKGRGLQAAGSAASAIPVYGQIAGAVLGGVGRHQEGKTRIPAEEQNRLALDLMRKAAFDPAGAVLSALRGYGKASQIEGKEGAGSYADVVSALRNLEDRDIVTDPSTGALIYAPRNVRAEPGTGEATRGLIGSAPGAGFIAGSPMGATGRATLGRLPGLGWLFGHGRRTPVQTTDVYGRRIYTGSTSG